MTMELSSVPKNEIIWAWIGETSNVKSPFWKLRVRLTVPKFYLITSVLNLLCFSYSLTNWPNRSFNSGDGSNPWPKNGLSFSSTSKVSSGSMYLGQKPLEMTFTYIYLEVLS